MTSAQLGKSTSPVEVQGISQFGVWLFVNGTEYFLSHKEFPWFESARISEIMNVRLVNGDHLEWPDLDVDLELDSLEHPEEYPLVYVK